MNEQEQKVLAIIKSRLGIDDDDVLIGSYITEIGNRIKHYCQRNDIPESLNWVWASMVIDALRVDQPDKYGVADDGYSLKIGDTTTGPAKGDGVTATNKKSIDDIVLNYKADLHRWRKLRW